MELIDHGMYLSYIVPNVDQSTFTIIPTESTSGSELYTVEGIGATIKSVAVDLDGYKWVAIYDGSETRIIKLSITGEVMESINIDNFEVDQIIVGGEDILYLKPKAMDTIRTINLHTATIEDTGDVGSDELMYLDISSQELVVVDTSDGPVIAVDQFDGGSVAKIIYYDATESYIYLNGSIYTAPNTQAFNDIACQDENICYATTKDASNNVYIHMYDRNAPYEVVIHKHDEIQVNSPNKVYLSKENVNSEIKIVINWICSDYIVRFIINEDNEFEELNRITLDSTSSSTFNGDCSGYRINRVKYVENGRVRYIKYSDVVKNDAGEVSKVVLTAPDTFLADDWNMIHIVEDRTAQEVSMYVNGVKSLVRFMDATAETIYSVESGLFIGAPSDGKRSANDALGIKDRNIDGIAEFEILRKATAESEIQAVWKSKFVETGIINLPIKTGKRNFVEEIQRIFKYKKPGIKTKLFNIVVNGIDLTDAEKEVYETLIRSTIEDTLPCNVELNEIIWS